MSKIVFFCSLSYSELTELKKVLKPLQEVSIENTFTHQKYLEVYTTENLFFFFFVICISHQIVRLFQYEHRKRIPYQFSSPHLWRIKVSNFTYRRLGIVVLRGQYRNASLAISLFFSCFSCAEEENCVDESKNMVVEYSE